MLGVSAPTASATDPAPEDTSKSCVFHVTLEARRSEQVLSLEQWESVEQLMAEGSALQETGTLASLQNAKSKFKQVIQITQIAGERRWQQRAWSQLGDTAFALDDPQEALTAYEQISPLLYPNDDNYEEQKVNVLGKIGKAYRALGQNQQALEIYNKVLVMIRRDDRWMDNCLREARTLNSIGEIYAEKGDPQKALVYFEQALKLRQLLMPHPIDFDPVEILNNQGKIYFHLGDISKAFSFFDWSFQIANWLNQSIRISLESFNSNSNSHEYELNNSRKEARLAIQQLSATIAVLNQLYPAVENPEQQVLYIDKLKECETLKAKLEVELKSLN